MDIKLIKYTNEPEKTIAACARVCYSERDCNDLMTNLTKEESEKMVAKLIDSGHLSALEHASFTFSISGISRACSHQLVRHRLASFNQQSQRYVKSEEETAVVMPESIAKSSHNSLLFDTLMSDIFGIYRTLIKNGIPKEDARYVLPNAAETNIVVTMNARELLHFFKLRCCKRAQWEIREVAQCMLILAKGVAPTIFKNAGASCKSGKCPEGKFSCKK